MVWRVLLIVVGVFMAVAVIAGTFVLGTRYSAQPAANPSAKQGTTAESDPTKAQPVAVAFTPPAIIKVVHSYESPPPLPTTDRSPTVVELKPAYQYQPSSAGYQPRLVPYPGAPYVPPTRPYDPHEPRYQTTQKLLQGANSELIPVVEEQVMVTPVPVILQRQPEPAASSASVPSEPTSVPPAPAGTTDPLPPPTEPAKKNDVSPVS